VGGENDPDSGRLQFADPFVEGGSRRPPDNAGAKIHQVGAAVHHYGSCRAGPVRVGLGGAGAEHDQPGGRTGFLLFAGGPGRDREEAENGNKCQESLMFCVLPVGAAALVRFGAVCVWSAAVDCR